MNVRGKTVLVVGLGKSGIAAVELLAARGARVIANDMRDQETLGSTAERVRAVGATLALGGHDERLFTSVDHIVVSPGVPPLPALQAADAAGVPVSSEIELASWFITSRIIAITGTNGKSTVTSLVGAMCTRTGAPTFVGGNLGTPLVDVVGSRAADPGGYVVVEVSSFQLERLHSFRAQVAVLLNVTEDHLDRYATFEDYADAKARIFERQMPGDAAIIPFGDDLCERLAARGNGAVHRFGKDGEVRVVGGRIQNGKSGLSLDGSELRIAGMHNLHNACAATLAARVAGVSVEHVTDVLRDFRGLPHRMQFVAEFRGVRYFDDSKATNVGATAAALDGLSEESGRVVLIGGGKDKGGSYAPIRDRVRSRVRGVVLIGEAAPLMEKALDGAGATVERAESLDNAVERAARLAEPGDIVLLAPACSSYDMFTSYAERGDVFQRAVRRLAGVPS